MLSSIANLVYKLPHDMTNDVRLRVLDNKEILEKSKIWVETLSSAQSPFQKLNFGNSSQKTRKSRYQTFLVLSSYTGFLYFVPNILSRIVAILLISVLCHVKSDVFCHALWCSMFSVTLHSSIKDQLTTV